MAIFKCKMCGGTIEFEPGATIGECDSCGTKQTLPKSNDEVITNLFNRANNLRLKCEFDKAEQIYEKIVQQDDTEAEAHWGIVLCKYGIEYVEDPKTFKRIPTCHRTLFEAVTADADYQAAIDYSDASQQAIYEHEARAIDHIQKGILEIVKNEKPFDVFICYKETDENGKRTIDSTIANDIYYQLTQEGIKVFYAAITLEDKLGQEYEPYIFAALNSAKVMLVIGTKPEYFSAVWVKNEWSRFLKLMKTDRNKLLIPCYRDMDAYDLPEEFAHLQAQDMAKIGFINDVVRGIKKVSSVHETKPQAQVTVPVNAGSANTAPLLKRAFMFLEDGNWQEANAYCEKVLDINPENALSYLGKLMAKLQVHKQDDLANCPEPFDGEDLYKKAVRFADANFNAVLTEYNHAIRYRIARKAKNVAITEKDFLNAAALFKILSGYKDSASLEKDCLDKAEICRKNNIYDAAKYRMVGSNIHDYESAIETFEKIRGWRDADEQIIACQKKIEEIKAKEEADRIEAAKAAKKRKKALAIGIPSVVACIAFVIILITVIIPNIKYNAAVDLMNDGKYDEAITAFESMNGYKDSATKASEVFAQYKIEKLKIAEVGDIVYFGAYEQDNDISNGKEDIEWLVLAKENGKDLVISKYAIDCQQYNESYRFITWENCSLRKWMDSTFLNNAFSAQEQAQIESTPVSADKNPYSTNPGNTTTDKVFLLSITEAEKYFTTDESRKCAPTAYAKAQGARTSDSCKTASGEDTCLWWLRSLGFYDSFADSVNYGGSVNSHGRVVDYSYGAVRPAMWINID